MDRDPSSARKRVSHKQIFLDKTDGFFTETQVGFGTLDKTSNLELLFVKKVFVFLSL